MPFTGEVAQQIADLLNTQNQLTRQYLAEDVLSEQESYTIRVNASGQVIGAVQVKKVQWYQCEICHLSVDPAARRQGIGAALLETAEARAASLGARIVQCTIRVGNEASEGLFMAHEYVRTATFVNSPNGNHVSVYQKVL